MDGRCAPRTPRGWSRLFVAAGTPGHFQYPHLALECSQGSSHTGCFQRSTRRSGCPQTRSRQDTHTSPPDTQRTRVDLKLDCTPQRSLAHSLA
eukprot:812108-Prymnesium_polylepis.1